MMLVRDLKELIHPPKKPGGVLLPQEVVQKHPHGVHAQVLRPTQFAVDRRQIKCVRLPHLQLIDGRAWNEIASDQEWLTRVPFVSLLRRPCGRVGGHHGRRNSEEKQDRCYCLVHEEVPQLSKRHCVSLNYSWFLISGVTHGHIL